MSAADDVLSEPDADNMRAQVVPTVLALQYTHRQYQRTVGVVARIARKRSGQSDAVRWTLRLYQFDDTEQFCHLESLLIALDPTAVYAPKGAIDRSTSDGRKLLLWNCLMPLMRSKKVSLLCCHCQS